MAESGKVAPEPGQGSPAPVAGQPSGDPGKGDAGRLSGLSETEEQAARDAFDGPGAPLRDESRPAKPATKAGAPAAAAKPGEVGEAGAAGKKDEAATDGTESGDESKPGEKKEGEEAVAAEKLPFDEELEGLTPLESGQPDPVEQLGALDTPEAITKALNPDGKTSEGDQLKNAQKLIGQFSGTIGQARKLMAEIAPFTMRNQAGEPVGFDLLAISNKMGDEATLAQLHAAGLKVLPEDWGVAEANLESQYPADLVNQIIAGDKSIEGADKLTFQEKVELIKSDPEKLVDLRSAKKERELNQRHQAERQVEAENGQMVKRLEQFAKDDKTFTHLRKGIAVWNKRLPESIGGALRAELCYRNAKLDRILSPEVRKAQSDVIRKRVEAELMQKFKLTSPVGGGGVVPAGSRRTAGVLEAEPEAVAAFG